MIAAEGGSGVAWTWQGKKFLAGWDGGLKWNPVAQSSRQNFSHSVGFPKLAGGFGPRTGGRGCKQSCLPEWELWHFECFHWLCLSTFAQNSALPGGWTSIRGAIWLQLLCLHVYVEYRRRRAIIGFWLRRHHAASLFGPGTAIWPATGMLSCCAARAVRRRCWAGHWESGSRTQRARRWRGLSWLWP